jgi:hypothetical protein
MSVKYNKLDLVLSLRKGFEAVMAAPGLTGGICSETEVSEQL